jgi:DNA modification methylase
MKPSESQGLYAWSHAYAGFSPNFAEAALASLQVDNESIVLDPFTGSGTSAVAAAKLGCKFIGSDLDPFSSLLAKAKTAFRVDPVQVQELLSEKPKKKSELNTQFSEEARESFSQADLSYASIVFQRIKSRLRAEGESLYQILLDNKGGKASGELVALVALLICAKGRSSATRGSNPVWFKRDSATFSEAEISLSDCAKNIASTMLADLAAYQGRTTEGRIKIRHGDFSSVRLRRNSVDFLLTSPPYLNRLDYIVSHLPELTLLSGLSFVDFEHLRKQMMGTTKMVSRPEIDKNWGQICLSTLEQIRNHKSVASSTYYYRFHAQYFSELFRFLVWSKKIMKEGAKGLLVIQDSYYKDIRIPIAEIIDEMGSVLGFKVDVVRTDKRHNHIGSMDPKQRAYVKSKELHEKTLSLIY